MPRPARPARARRSLASRPARRRGRYRFSGAALFRARRLVSRPAHCHADGAAPSRCAWAPRRPGRTPRQPIAPRVPAPPRTDAGSAHPTERRSDARFSTTADRVATGQQPLRHPSTSPSGSRDRPVASYSSAAAGPGAGPAPARTQHTNEPRAVKARGSFVCRAQSSVRIRERRAAKNSAPRIRARALAARPPATPAPPVLARVCASLAALGLGDACTEPEPDP